jgi:hypothetical protein
VFVAAAALRGFVPGVETTPREPAADNPLAAIVVVGLLVAAVAVVTVAVFARLRDGGRPSSHPAGRPDWFRRERGRPSWRIWLVAFGVVLAWLLVAMVLGRLGGGGETPAVSPGSGTGGTDAEPRSDGAGGTLPLDPGTDWNLLAYFYAASVVFLFVLVTGSVIASRRQRRPVRQTAILRADYADVAPPESGSESLARAAEVGLAEVGDLSREPRKAIIACYAAMERELSLLPDAAPRDFDTASEVLARAVDHHALRPDSATQLVDLFDEARFSPHVMDEGHRDAAVAVLTQVLDELRSHA